MEMGDRIKQRRIAMGLTQEELAQKLGLQKSAIAKYENGRVTNIKRTTIQKMALALDCTPVFLMGFTEETAEAVRIPVFGRVAAGVPLEMITEILDWEEIPVSMARGGEYFALKIAGQSMEPKISDGDVVIIRKQPDAETGDIVIATVNGEAATCKRLKKYRDGVELIPLNPAYQPLFFTNEEIKEKPVTILGRVVELRAKF